MTENLSYLFVAGMILGSGPCLGFCAPFLIAYTAAQKAGLKNSLVSCGIFSVGKLISYGLWGILSVLGAAFLQSRLLEHYVPVLYAALGLFIAALGLATFLGKEGPWSKACACLHQGYARNVGVAGFLVGLSPCLPLLGIVNYVALIARGPWDAMAYLLTFGAGTVLSPLVLATALSGKFAQMLSVNPKARQIIRCLSGGALIVLGVKIIFDAGLIKILGRG